MTKNGHHIKPAQMVKWITLAQFLILYAKGIILTNTVNGKKPFSFPIAIFSKSDCHTLYSLSYAFQKIRYRFNSISLFSQKLFRNNFFNTFFNLTFI